MDNIDKEKNDSNYNLNKYENKNNVIIYNSNEKNQIITKRNKLLINDEFNNDSFDIDSEEQDQLLMIDDNKLIIGGKFSNDNSNKESEENISLYSNKSQNDSKEPLKNINKNQKMPKKKGKKNPIDYRKGIFISKDFYEDSCSSESNQISNSKDRQLMKSKFNNFPSPYFHKVLISLMDETEIIQIFYSFDLIIYTDDYKLRDKNCVDIFTFFTKKRYISKNNLPGIAFISVDSIPYLKEVINNHNKDLQDSDYELSEILMLYQICFDEGDFFKNMLYKKLQVHDKLLFVPYNKYQLKLTEYKLRSFCQIMEELGAVEIEIDFNHINLNKKSNNLKIQTEEFNYIAGSLGFSANKNSSSNEDITYKLSYPHNNTLILNEKNIRSRIAKGKFIINKKSFDSNLELQFIITSRCRHFIENYSTVFTLDNSSNYDTTLISNLKSDSFSSGIEYESKTFKKLKISINTKVKFCNKDEIGNNLLGNNVSFDDSGFNFLMSSINNEKFKTIGIFKIIAFIEKYIDKVIKREENTDYANIKRLYKIIYKEFSANEYKDLLLDYFNPDSQWINFLNFINVLKFKTVSYNKLGFLVLMSQNKIPVYEKNLKVIDFIRHLCEKNNYEDKFWDMLEPSNYFSITHKLDKNYNILRKYNWFNIQKLLRDISKFTPDLMENFNSYKIDCEEFYGKMIKNFKLGHSYSQYQKNIKKFLYKFISIHYENELNSLNEISNNEIIFINLMYQSIKLKHFITHDINTISKLKTLISNKFNQIEESCKFYKELLKNINLKLNSSNFSIFQLSNSNTDVNIIDSFFEILKLMIEKDSFKKEYNYIFRKFSLMLYKSESNDKDNQYDENNCILSNELIELIKISVNTSTDINKICLNFIKKLVIYDFEISNHDFTRENLTESYFNYINDYVRNFNQSKICYIKVRYFVSLCNFIINQNYYSNFKKHSFFATEILKLHQTNESFSLEDISYYNLSNETINLIKEIIICYNYKHILSKVIFYLKNELKLDIRRDVIELLD